ncbi:DUF4348 domain-containing protein [Bernardetia sp.]|uniref:DUF4348 domain-containing protein n=1 Tax=Bernardetia sp. TaxID=1937974 RepID=UPI0025BF572B|nr:DUF4348 domain-containing protein [Bernardetia sp.]
MKHILALFLFFILCSCQNETSENKKVTDSTLTNSIQKEESGKIDFDTFFQKYRTDSVFQLKHTKFPLKSFYIDETEDTSINFISEKKWQFNDFKDDKTSEYDQYEFVKNPISSDVVHYEMEGIDNGISVIYKFEFDGQEWSLIEIEDASY